MIQDRSYGRTKFGNFDTSSIHGAQRLCDMIKAHWAKQGKLVTAWPVLMPRIRDDLGQCWGVKSDIKITHFTAPLPEIVLGCSVPSKPAKPRKEAA